jgi:glyoxylase-like metal-dependent hydrolase (beta-lactamase superfamily II)
MNRVFVARPRAIRLTALIGAVLLLLATGLSEHGSAQQPAQGGTRPAPQAAGDGEVHVLPVQGNVYMLVGAGGNITMQAGPEGIVLVDTGNGRLTEKVMQAIRTISDKPVRFVINTHVHPDHVGGNEQLSKIGHDANRLNNNTEAGPDQGAPIIAHESVLNRMSMPEPNQPAPPPFEAWPTLTFTDKKEVYVNGEAIEIFSQPAAHTDGDAIVFFRKSDVVSAGDIFVTTSYPIVDLQRGGGINGIVDGLNHIIDITIPQNIQEGGTQVIPGHGRLAEESDVVEYRDMVTIIRDRFLDAVKKGQTLEQVKAARLTRDYDGRYGATSGFWTTDMFVEAVYKDLSARTPKPAAAPATKPAPKKAS